MWVAYFFFYFGSKISVHTCSLIAVFALLPQKDDAISGQKLFTLQTVVFWNMLLVSSPANCLILFFWADASDLDNVSHGSLDSSNDSAERASIDTDFTKMDSSDDRSSTGTRAAFILSVFSFHHQSSTALSAQQDVPLSPSNSKSL